MASTIETVIQNLRGLGFFEFFLPFMLTSAIFYGFLRKSKLFGEPKDNISVNAVVALIAAFMVWVYPVLAGVSFVTELAAFFTQATLFMLGVLIGMMMLTMFVPEEGLAKKLTDVGLGKKFYGGLVVVFILIGFGLLISSGLITVFFPQGITLGEGLSDETVLTVGMIILMVGTVVVLVYGGK